MCVSVCVWLWVGVTCLHVSTCISTCTTLPTCCCWQVKLWAEAHGLNNPKAGTLNSWSLFNAVILSFPSPLPHSSFAPPSFLHNLARSIAPEVDVASAGLLFISVAPRRQVVFHLQALKVVPPLWQLVQDGPDDGPRPLEPGPCQPQQQQLWQQQDAPYDLLDVAADKREELQECYAGGDGNHSLLELLAGFFVRFSEALTRWLREEQFT